MSGMVMNKKQVHSKDEEIGNWEDCMDCYGIGYIEVIDTVSKELVEKDCRKCKGQGGYNVW